MVIEGANAQAEGEQSTSEKGIESTPQTAEPTVKTYTETEFQRAVSKGLESTTKQLSKAQTETDKASKSTKALEAQVSSLQGEYDRLAEKQFAEDPAAREAFLDRKSIADEQRKLDKERAELSSEKETRDLEVWQIGMNRRADELVKETGVSLDSLKDCKTETEMEVKSLKFQIAKVPEVIPAPKFDSGKSSVAGLPEHPSTEQLANASIEDYEKWARPRLDKL